MLLKFSRTAKPQDVVASQGMHMGLTYAAITVENMFRRRRVEITAMVDSGCVFLTIPAHIALQLGFDVDEVPTRAVTLADGTSKAVPQVGPVRVYFADRYCDMSALVLGDEPLLGAVPMEMMDLVLNPATQSLTINPANPFVPGAMAKVARAEGAISAGSRFRHRELRRSARRSG